MTYIPPGMEPKNILVKYISSDGTKLEANFKSGLVVRTRAYNKDGTPTLLFEFPVFFDETLKCPEWLKQTLGSGGCKECGWTGVKDLVVGDGSSIHEVKCECMYPVSSRDEIGEPVKEQEEEKKINFREFL